MNDILRPEGANPGGIRKLEFTPKYAVAGFPDITDCAIAEDLTFKAGFRWYVIECIENTLSYDVEQNDTDNGLIYKVAIDGVLRGENAVLKKLLQNMAETNAFYLKPTDTLGEAFLVGYGSETAKFSYKKKSGDGMAGLRSYSFKFYEEFTVSPPLYDL